MDYARVELHPVIEETRLLEVSHPLHHIEEVSADPEIGRADVKDNEGPD